jgi:uncharacterized protein YbaP (TraB family)
MLLEPEALSINVRAIAVAWKAGDVGTLERLLVGEMREIPELYRRLLVERNQTWLPRVEDCVTRHAPCFVVVGAAHLVGPDSLIALLRARGYKVEQQ